MVLTHVVQPYGTHQYHVWLFRKFAVWKRFGLHLPHAVTYPGLGRDLARGFRR